MYDVTPKSNQSGKYIFILVFHEAGLTGPGFTIIVVDTSTF